MAVILVVEDDIALSRLMQTVLQQSGYTVEAAAGGEQALEVLDKRHVDMLVTDIMMPGMDGFQLVETLREGGCTMPVLFVTARSTFDDKARGFRIGADDYMVKPIDIKEMVLRVGALLRRSQIATEHRLTVGDVVLDANSLSVCMEGREETLPMKEFQLLFKLLSYPGRVFTRFELMEEVWGYDSQSDDKTVNVHISKLRSRFETCTAFRIVTVRGLGYKAVIL